MPMGRGGKRAPTARDYIQSGLVAMWDGIENAGWGVHDASATVWKDLVGSRNATLRRASNGWGSDHLKTRALTGGSQSTISAATFSGIDFSPGITLELVYKITTPQNSNGEALVFVGGYSRFAISNISGGSAGKIFIVSSPDTRISVVMDDPDTDANLVDLGVVHPVSIVCGQSNSIDGWAVFHCGRGQPVYVRGGPLGAQENGTGSLVGRLISNTAPDNATGELYCVRLYSRALTADEIAHNYAIDKKRFNLP
jgi:hypothetical protein